MLFYQMSRMCREKGAVRHDDRIDCLAQGVKYFTDAMGLSAQEEIKARKREEWNQMLEAFIEDPQQSANAIAWYDRRTTTTSKTGSFSSTGFKGGPPLYRREGWTPLVFEETSNISPLLMSPGNGHLKIHHLLVC